MIRLGYACISNELRDKGIFTSRTLTLKSLCKKGQEEAKDLSLQNLRDLVIIIKYNELMGIRFFRLSSNMFPHMENPKACLKDYNLSFAIEELKSIGRLIKELGHRITMHPGQFAQLGSPRDDVIDQTYRDLAMHAQIFQEMQLTPEMGSVLIIHGGGSYGNKSAALERWKVNFQALPEEVSKYIVLENDEWQYSVLDLLPLCEDLNIPLCIDFFHHQVGHEKQFDIFNPILLDRVIKTWQRRNIKPKCHWSNQAPGKRLGTHGPCVSGLPVKILKFCQTYNVDIMIEAKDKDLCTLKIYKKYFDRIVNEEGRVDWILKEKWRFIQTGPAREIQDQEDGELL